MNLQSITKSGTSNPKIVIYGRDGIGKTTWARGAPSPVFIPTEDGLCGLDVPCFPLCESLGDTLDCISALHDQHEYKTVVLDSADWLEQLIWRVVAAQAGEKTVDAISYGKGYASAASEFRAVLDGLTSLSRRGMIVIVLAHAQIRRLDDPAHGDSYDRYTLKLHQKSASLLMEWADCVGYATSEIAIVKREGDFGTKKAHGVSIGGRVVHWQPSPAYDAKCRYPQIPETLPLDWQSFYLAMKGE